MSTLLVVVMVSLVSAACSYLGLLALLGRRPPGRSDDGSAETLPAVSLAVVIPAHDEEDGIEATIASVLAARYPPALRRVIVVADNCSDRTAARARRAGVEVWERSDRARRGKGYALEWAFAQLAREHRGPEVVVTVDADTVVSRGFLCEMVATLARGEAAVQADYRIRNLHASWRTELMALAFAMFHHTRSLARMRLGLSVGLRGNGMGFSAKVLREIPFAAHSVVEDVEYGILLALAGHRIAYAPHARVFGEMPIDGGGGAVSQRRRWEGGRRQLRHGYVRRLLRAAVETRSAMPLEVALDLYVPPLSGLALTLVAGTCTSAALFGPLAALAHWCFAWLCLGAYLLRGVQHSGLGWRGPYALARAPVYALWKLFIVRPWRTPRDWVRTARKAGVAPPEEAPVRARDSGA